MAKYDVFMSPTDKDSGITITDKFKISYTGATGTYRGARANLGRSTGKWYFEFEVTNVTSYVNGAGIATKNQLIGGFTNATGFTEAIVYSNNGTKISLTNSGSSYGALWSSGHIIGVLVDLDVGTVEYTRNGLSQGVAQTNLTKTEWYPYVVGVNPTFAGTINFGDSPFKYQPKEGFLPYVGINNDRYLINSNSNYYSINDSGNTLYQMSSIDENRILTYGNKKSLILSNPVNNKVYVTKNETVILNNVPKIITIN